MNAAKTSIRKALSLSFVRTGVSIALSLASVTIISRLLTPAEVGVYSVAAALVALAHMLRNFGVTELIVQEKYLTEDIVRTAFTVNLAIAWLLAAALFGFSGLVGQFYGDAGVARVTRALSLLFILMPFGTTTLACMKREMQFGLLVKLQIAETIVQNTCAIGLAYLGFSYMSMAWASVGSMAVLVAGCAIWGTQHRVYGVGLAEWKRVLHFGSNRTIADIAVQVGERSADIVVGRMLGMAAAGFYSRGYGLVNVFRANVVGAIGTVAFPAYAREHRETDTAPLLFRRSLVYLTGVSWPFFAFATLMAFPIIRIMFGNQWDAAIPLMRWLCGAAIVGTLIYQCNSMLTAVGHYREVTRIEVQYQLVRVGLAVVAAFYSLEAVAASQILVYVVATTLYYRKLSRYEALRLRHLINALAPSAALTVATSVVSAAILVLWPGARSVNYVPVFFVTAACASMTWLVGIFLLRHPLSGEVLNVLSMLRRFLRSAPKPG